MKKRRVRITIIQIMHDSQEETKVSYLKSTTDKFQSVQVTTMTAVYSFD